MKLLTPLGVSDFLPDETVVFEAVLARLSRVFEVNGYRKVQTPTLEYYETLALGMGDDFQDLAVKFFDPNGQVMVLRPDHTVPIARLVATRMRNESMPLRLAYQNPIFRNPGPGSDQEMEVFQAGLELIGDAKVEADVEVIGLCIESILALGYSHFVLDIGHAEFVNEFSPAQRQALLKQDYVSLGEIPKRGGAEIVTGYPDLVRLYELLKAKGYDRYVAFNKGLVKELDYYTGMIFEVSVPGFSKIVASGGRYDGLLGRFGFDCPAVGFAIHVSELNRGEK